MCNCGYGRCRGGSSPRISFDTVEEYIAYLDGLDKIDFFNYRPLPVNLQNVSNFVLVVTKHPEVYERIPQRYRNSKTVKAAAGIEA